MQWKNVKRMKRNYPQNSFISNGNTGTLSPGVKRPGREADNSPVTCAVVKNAWIYIYLPTNAFMA
jgi:hypothetical protein